MHAFDVLADPVRRQLIGALAHGEFTAGELLEIVRSTRTISQPAVSQHLKILRENRFATVRADGTTRVYVRDDAGLDAADVALARLRAPVAASLAALHTEVARGKRARRAADERAPLSTPTVDTPQGEEAS